MSKLAKALTAAAGNAGESLYVEDVFSTYLYEGGNGSGTNQAVNVVNDVNLNEEGGLIWLKRRDVGNSHALIDTERGRTQWLNTDTTSAAISATGIDSFNTDGFTVSSTGYGETNNTSGTYASWTFRKAEKFFDVVTYTGNSTAGRTVAHNLGSVPAVIIVKETGGTGQWSVYHKDLTSTAYHIALNSTEAETTFGDLWNSTTPTDSVFSLGSNPTTNNTGDTYVAYLFASDAGGFGDDGSESIIKCGSYTGNGSTDGPEIDCGFEPQFLLLKSSTLGDGANWLIYDSMRGFVTGGDDAYLRPNLSGAEGLFESGEFLANGFKLKATDGSLNGSGQNYIYIAIRRPMKTPESGTEVYKSIARAGTGTSTTITGVGFAPDASIIQVRNVAYGSRFLDRLRNKMNDIYTTGAEQTITNAISSWNMDGVTVATDSATNGSGNTFVDHYFKRATGFFDVVAYTGTGSATTQEHNLGVAPELMIIKRRSSSGSDWWVYNSPRGATKSLRFTNDAEFTLLNIWNNTEPTSSVFTIGADSSVNGGGSTYIAYLFDTLAGVSKVGSYTGTAANLDVDCGFSAGARFILIKRTDSTGDWYVYDSARGIVAGNDPYLLLNSTAAEVTSTDYIDPLSSGFTVTSSAPAALNASGGTYIFLAIA